MHSMNAKLRTMENCVCFNLRCASRAMTRFYEAALAGSDLKVTQTPILGALAANPDGLTMARLSEWLEMDRTTLLRNLRPLEKQGFVKLATDGRRTVLLLTKAGQRALADSFKAWQKAQQRVTATLGAKRWEEIIRDLEKAAAALAV
jgi:DNA-binding MarR family transcriptional regulator